MCIRASTLIHRLSLEDICHDDILPSELMHGNVPCIRFAEFGIVAITLAQPVKERRRSERSRTTRPSSGGPRTAQDCLLYLEAIPHPCFMGLLPILSGRAGYSVESIKTFVKRTGVMSKSISALRHQTEPRACSEGCLTSEARRLSYYARNRLLGVSSHAIDRKYVLSEADFFFFSRLNYWESKRSRCQLVNA